MSALREPHCSKPSSWYKRPATTSQWRWSLTWQVSAALLSSSLRQFTVAGTDAMHPLGSIVEVKLIKNNSLNLGISIGGSKQPGDVIWIADIKKGGVASRVGALQPGDELLRVDGNSLETATPADAALLLKCSGNVVVLTVRKCNPTDISESSTLSPSLPLSSPHIVSSPTLVCSSCACLQAV